MPECQIPFWWGEKYIARTSAERRFPALEFLKAVLALSLLGLSAVYLLSLVRTTLAVALAGWGLWGTLLSGLFVGILLYAGFLSARALREGTDRAPARQLSGLRRSQRPRATDLRLLRSDAVDGRRRPDRSSGEKSTGGTQRIDSSARTVSDISHASSRSGSSMLSAKNDSRPSSTVIR